MISGNKLCSPTVSHCVCNVVMHKQRSVTRVGVWWFNSDKQDEVNLCRCMRTLAEEMACSAGEFPGTWITQGVGKGLHLSLGEWVYPWWCLNVLPCVCVSRSPSSVTDQHLNQRRSHSGIALSKQQQKMLGQSFNSIEDWALGYPMGWSPGLLGKQEWSSEEHEVAGCESRHLTGKL